MLTKPFLTRKISQNRYWLGLLAILILYAVLLLPTLARLGVSWDEQVDLWIAQAYQTPGGWLQGSDLDLSQARLPMFIVALFWHFTGMADLLTARLISVGVGALAIIGVYTVGLKRFSPKRGLLAALFLAASPFYLSFARVAFTETDVYLACALIWLFVCLARYQDQPTVGRGAAAGLVLGMAISSKFTAVVIMPALWIALLHAKPSSAKGFRHRSVILAWSLWSLLLPPAGWSLLASLQNPNDSKTIQTLIFFFLLLNWLLILAWSYLHRKNQMQPVLDVLFISAIGLFTALLVPPEHLTNPRILLSLFQRFDHEMTYSLRFAGEAAGLHGLSVLFKSTPLLGLFLLIGPIAAIKKWSSPGIQFPLLAVLLYTVGLLILPLAQTFYMVPTLPILSIFAAELFSELTRRWRSIGAALLLITVGWLGFELAQCYPDYNLNGYQWLGARTLFGRSSIGYRSVVQISSDGTKQSMEWLNQNTPTGSDVLTYVMPLHIVKAYSSGSAYQVRNGFREIGFGEADYVVVQFNSTVWHGWGEDTPLGEVYRYPYDLARLEQQYVKVFRVMRVFNIEVASVWKKKIE